MLLYKKRAHNTKIKDMDTERLAQTHHTARDSTSKHQANLDGMLMAEHVRKAAMLLVISYILLVCNASATSVGAILMPLSVVIALFDNIACSDFKNRYARTRHL